jgi:hypothetical protein
MPNYFAFYQRDWNDRAALVDIDRQLCEYFDVPVHPTLWFRDWYNRFGLSLAAGVPMQELIDRQDNPSIDRDLLVWLDTNYRVECGYMPR